MESGKVQVTQENADGGYKIVLEDKEIGHRVEVRLGKEPGFRERLLHVAIFKKNGLIVNDIKKRESQL